ncbi:MAG: DUF2200 domain-containing protein, partial [Planctomycetes bacterium]|nr:DUF2200 domain-containing protein [Planctomycetota bacterium]
AALGWLTGYDPTGLQRQIAARVDLRGFFASAPALHPERERERITGVVCGVRVEAIDDPLLRLTRQMDKLLIRQMDKLVDELAKGKPLAKALRA